MGRLGKVASPALSGNVNPRLMRHKSTDTTLRKGLNTDSSQTAPSPAGLRSCAGATASPAMTALEAMSAVRSGVSGACSRVRPGRYASVNARQSTGHANVKSQRRPPRRPRPDRAPPKAGSIPPGLRSIRPAQRASSWHGRAGRLSPPRCHIRGRDHRRATPAGRPPPGITPGRESAGAGARRWPPRRRQGRARR